MYMYLDVLSMYLITLHWCYHKLSFLGYWFPKHVLKRWQFIEFYVLKVHVLSSTFYWQKYFEISTCVFNSAWILNNFFHFCQPIERFLWSDFDEWAVKLINTLLPMVVLRKKEKDLSGWRYYFDSNNHCSHNDAKTANANSRKKMRVGAKNWLLEKCNIVWARKNIFKIYLWREFGLSNGVI